MHNKCGGHRLLRQLLSFIKRGLWPGFEVVTLGESQFVLLLMALSSQRVKHSQNIGLFSLKMHPFQKDLALPFRLCRVDYGFKDVA